MWVNLNAAPPSPAHLHGGRAQRGARDHCFTLKSWETHKRDRMSKCAGCLSCAPMRAQDACRACTPECCLTGLHTWMCWMCLASLQSRPANPVFASVPASGSVAVGCCGVTAADSSASPGGLTTSDRRVRACMHTKQLWYCAGGCSRGPRDLGIWETYGGSGELGYCRT